MASPRRRYQAGRLDAGAIAYDILGTAAALGEAALGPEAISLCLDALGPLVGGEVEDQYRKRWNEWKQLTPAQYGYLVADLYGAMGGASALASADAEKVTVNSLRCPFGRTALASESLCTFTSSLFGTIAANNFGYAWVVRKHQTPVSEVECETTVYLTPSVRHEMDRGIEYRAAGVPRGRHEVRPMTSRADTIARAGWQLRGKLLAMDVPADRWRLLGETARLFSPSASLEEVVREIVTLGVRELGEGCAVCLSCCEGSEGSGLTFVQHADPSAAQLVRQLLVSNGGEQLGEIGRALREGRPFLAADLRDGDLAIQPEALQALDRVGLASLLLVPLPGEASPVGCLVCLSGPERRLDVQDLRLATRFAAVGASAIEVARRHRTLRGEIDIRDSFTTAAFHELATALARMKALAQITGRALEKKELEGVPRAGRNLETMARHIDLLAGVIRDVSDAFAITTSGTEFRGERCSLNDLVATVVERFKGIGAELSRFRLKVELPRMVLIGLWDPIRVEQVLTSLLANAVNFSPNGGLLTVQVELAAADELKEKIGTAVRIAAPAAVITVRDEGIGIPTSELDSIFTPFSRGHSNRRTPQQGLGLGLYVSKGIVEAHGGRIWVESEEGRGSAFHFSLPLLETKP